MAIASSLLQAIKKSRQALMRFSKDHKFGEKIFVIDKGIQRLLKPCTFYRSSHFQQPLNNFVSCEFFFTKLSGIDPCEKCINRINGHAWRHFFMACSKLEAMAIYVVKSTNANDILALLYLLCRLY